MRFTPEVEKKLGTSGEKFLGKDANGVDIFAPDDVGVGKAFFNGTYDQAKGKLEAQQQNVANTVNDLNVLFDSHASPQAKLSATGGLILAVTGIALYGAQIAGLLTAAEVASAVPVVGLYVAAALIAMTIIIYAFTEIFGGDTPPVVDTPVQAALKTVPPAMDFKDVPINEQVLAATYWVCKALDNELRGDPKAGEKRLQLAFALNNDSGRADTLHDIVGRVLLDPRWKLNREPGQRMLAVDGLNGGVRVGTQSRGISTLTYAELLTYWKNQFPSLIDLNSHCYYIDQEGKIIFTDPNTKSLLPEYLAMYAAAAIVANLPTPASFAYMGIYQLLIARGWIYRSAKQEIPENELACQGFLLDLLSQTPMARRPDSRLGAVSARRNAPVLVKDAAYYVRYYLEEEAKAKAARTQTLNPSTSSAAKAASPQAPAKTVALKSTFSPGRFTRR